MDKFLIVRLSSLGDIIHTLPAFQALRKNFPEAKITWLVEEKGRQILDLVPGIDRVISFRLKGKSPFSIQFWKESRKLLKSIRDKEQTVIDFQGLIKSGVLCFLSRAKKRISFNRENLREKTASWFYTETLEKLDENMHVIQKNLRLLDILGIHEEKYEFPLLIPNDLKDKIDIMLAGLGYSSGKKIILFNVGAAWETKLWPADKWKELIERLSKARKDIFPLLLWGAENEKKIADEVRKHIDAASVPMLSIQTAIALINQADLVVSGDTFALQAACALSRPVVGIFGPTNPKRNGPFRPQDKVVFHEIECSYCYKRTCPNCLCLEKTTAEETAYLSLQALEENE
ncbi:MAG: lipopolysaccharide heptosyltransferase I [Candidatus Aminicenantes bacterium]|nr:lipopolysaccharide heptosyltransferase I [Candidatus Aminicenantes bacterium]